MTNRIVACIFAIALPILAAAEQQAGRGACEYSSENPKEKGLTFCTHVADEAHCTADAGTKGTSEWVASHPPKFTPGKTCVKPKAAKKSTKAKRASP